jgi:type II secretory pathway component PulF
MHPLCVPQGPMNNERNALTVKVAGTQPTYRWALSYSSIAFVLLILMQSYGVSVAIPKFRSLLANFGSDLPAITLFTLKYYWIGCFGNTTISIASTTFIWLKPRAAETRLKFAYGLALLALVAAFIWSGIVLVALYLPIFKLGAMI